MFVGNNDNAESSRVIGRGGRGRGSGRGRGRGIEVDPVEPPEFFVS